MWILEHYLMALKVIVGEYGFISDKYSLTCPSSSDMNVSERTNSHADMTLTDLFLRTKKNSPKRTHHHIINDGRIKKDTTTDTPSYIIELVLPTNYHGFLIPPP